MSIEFTCDSCGKVRLFEMESEIDIFVWHKDLEGFEVLCVNSKSIKCKFSRIYDEVDPHSGEIIKKFGKWAGYK